MALTLYCQQLLLLGVAAVHDKTALELEAEPAALAVVVDLIKVLVLEQQIKVMAAVVQ
jgi:hypothetical protein